MKIIFSLILIYITYVARAATPENECGSLDLRTPELNKIRNQKDVAWCYAFTSADLLNNVFPGHPRFSAADIAINYNQSKAGKLIKWYNDLRTDQNSPVSVDDYKMAHQTGFAKIALNRSMRDGVCSEGIFPSESWIKMVRGGQDWIEKEVDLKRAMLEIYDLLMKQDDLTPSNLPFWFRFHNVDTPEEFYDVLKGSNRKSFYSKLRNKVCDKSNSQFSNHWKVKMVLKNRNVFNRINEQLDLGRLVSLDYDSRLLKNKDHKGFNLNKLHTSLIVGRRWSNEKSSCEFLIRDSYGNKCSGYDSSYECLGGQVWIPEESIHNAMVSVVYMLSH